MFQLAASFLARLPSSRPDSNCAPTPHALKMRSRRHVGLPLELRSAFTLAPLQGTLKPDGALSMHGNHPVFGVKRKWLIKIRTKAVKAARVVNTRAASSLDRADSRAAAGSRSPASSSRSPDAKAASRVAKAARATSADCLKVRTTSPLRRGFFRASQFVAASYGTESFHRCSVLAAARFANAPKNQPVLSPQFQW